MRKARVVSSVVAAVTCTLPVFTTPVFAASNTNTPTVTETQRPYPGRLVRIGSFGETVKVVQRRLNDLGFSVGAVDGDFGPLTQAGVERFQRAHHLVVDGVVGPQTWAALFPEGKSTLLEGVQHYVNTRHSEVSVAVYDANTHRTYVYNPKQTFATASIVKPLILATLLHENQVSHKSLTPLDNELAIPMIEESNNSDATRLWDIVGRAQSVQRFAGLVGMTQTTANQAGYWGLTRTSALDEVSLVKEFAYPNNLLTTASRNYVLNLMNHVTSWERWGVSAGVPNPADVDLKNGWLPLSYRNWEINSIGYVHDAGRNYVIAVLGDDNPTEQYGIQTVEGISRIVWSNVSK